MVSNGTEANVTRALGQEADAASAVLQSFDRTAGVMQRFGEWLGKARRRAIAGCGLGAAGMALGVLLVPGAQVVILAPLIGVALGALGVLVIRASPTEERDEEIRKLKKNIEFAEEHDLPTGELAARFLALATADAAEIRRLVSPGTHRLLPQERAKTSPKE